MKKVSIIVLGKYAETAVKKLRRVGALHVEHSRPPQGPDIGTLEEDLVILDACLDVFKKMGIEARGGDAEAKTPSDWRHKAGHIANLWRHYDQLESFSNSLLARVAELEKWGDFDPREIEGLRSKGLYLKLYQVPLSQVNNFPQDAIVRKVFVAGGMAGCAVISLRDFETPFKEVGLPDEGLSSMRAKINEDKKTMEGIIGQIKRAGEDVSAFLAARQHLEKEIEFHKALAGMGREGEISYISGYLPAERTGDLAAASKENKWGLYISDPMEEDNVPVLLRNPKWVSLIAPVYKLMEVVPGYRELDVSPIFLLFLSLFFGMIIGDAGYGLVYFALTFLAHIKFSGKVKDKTVFFLFYQFSFCAVMWGLLTGTVFGQQWYLARGFKALAPVLNDAKALTAFCFLLGAIQLSLGHAWQALKKMPSLTALAEAGFICLLWAGFLLAKMFIIGDPFPAIGQWLVWTGIALVILFVSPQKNFLAGIGAGLGTLALGIMGNFGDVVSYIRLFAVGLAGVAVADSVNLLAAGAGGNIIAQVLILLIGHTINIILGPMSVLVHGVRLNVLEFSLLHGNVTWGGLAYKPLKE
ncbi:MAG: hypothetical protein HY589_04240 [Candidatus Omnitrophica bacterium]|nr:hypothetical protein [Candidatus Omnitrophota bacterium]